MKTPFFYSKILLFGEYGIMEDSRGLSIPYSFYNGLLKITTNHTTKIISSNKTLKTFCKYLSSLSSGDLEKINIDMNALKRDIDRGMYFDSSIPQGYGIGSSGALVAAVYDKYAKEKITVSENVNRDKLSRLKNIFSVMESFFHGTSSGIDPLNSYLSLPILVGMNKKPEVIGIPESKHHSSRGTIFLLDSGTEGKTAPMLKVFFEKMTQKTFRDMLRKEFIKHTEDCISDFLKGDVKSLFSNIKRLSQVAFKHFKPMIPSKVQELWRKGIETNDYYLKLCGSGGGGYILGFTKDISKTKKILKDYKIEEVYYL